MKKITLILMGVAIYIIFFTGFVQASFDNERKYADEYEIYEVQSGDTLWSIADRFNDDRGIPLLKMLDQLYKVNQIEGAVIHPGQQLKIPK